MVSVENNVVFVVSYTFVVIGWFNSCFVMAGHEIIVVIFGSKLVEVGGSKVVVLVSPVVVIVVGTAICGRASDPVTPRITHE